MYTQPMSSQAEIKLASLGYVHSTFYQSLIVLLGLSYFVKFYRQITIKKGLFGENYTESANQIIIYKSDLAINATANNTAESLFAALIMNAVILNPNFNNTTANLSAIETNQSRMITTFWLTFFDRPLDNYYELDLTLPFNPDDL